MFQKVVVISSARWECFFFVPFYCTRKRCSQRQFRYVCIVNQNAFRSEICIMFFILHNNALCSEILVHFNCTPIRFLQRHLWYVILVHKNALCSEMFVVLYCTPTRFLQRIFWYSLLYTKTLCAAKFWYIFTPKRFLQRNLRYFLLYTKTLCAANVLNLWLPIVHINAVSS